MNSDNKQITFSKPQGKKTRNSIETKGCIGQRQAPRKKPGLKKKIGKVV
jgi:hypothetical protein